MAMDRWSQSLYRPFAIATFHGNVFEYGHKSCIASNHVYIDCLGYILVVDSMGLSSNFNQFDVIGVERCGIR